MNEDAVNLPHVTRAEIVRTILSPATAERLERLGGINDHEDFAVSDIRFLARVLREVIQVLERIE